MFFTASRLDVSPCTRIAAGLSLFLALFLFPASARPCEQIPAGQSFWIRLVDPVASYSSKPGAAVRAVLIQSPGCYTGSVFPVGSEVQGEIIAVHKVGLGFKREVATIEIQFNRIVAPDGESFPIVAQLMEIDNARESVRNGVIHGIRATNTPQGRITSRLIHMPTFNPYTDWGLIVYRSIFTKLPEPEIYLPPGTDLRMQFNQALKVVDQPELPAPDYQMNEYERGEVEALVEHSADRTTTRYGKDADLVNLVFVGSREQIQQAFTAAGWKPGDPNSTQAFFKQLAAFLTFSNYPNMPVSHQLLNGEPQDFTWQKSFDSYEKREHLRLWDEPATIDGQQAWLGAYARETSAVLSVKYHKFIHHVDRNIDQGTLMLIRDLSLAGCVDSVRQLPRPNFPENITNATGDEMHTDGVLNVVHLKSCTLPAVIYTSRSPLVPVHPHSKVTRYIRTQVLIYKSDVVRGNIVYGAFDVCRMGIRSLRHHHDAPDDPPAPLPPSAAVAAQLTPAYPGILP